MQQIGKISLEKIKWLPSTYANIFKEQHQIVTDLIENMGSFNEMRYEHYLEDLQREMEADTYGLDTGLEYYLAESESSTRDFRIAVNRYYKEQDLYIATYHKNMQLLDKIREDLLND